MNRRSFLRVAAVAPLLPLVPAPADGDFVAYFPAVPWTGVCIRNHWGDWGKPSQTTIVEDIRRANELILAKVGLE